MIFNGKENVFEQIANNYKKLIINGVIKYGEYLPSCRELAKELGINPNTVQKAYTLLEDNGYVTKVIKKGVFVSYNSMENNIYLDFKKSLDEFKNKGLSKLDAINILNEAYGGDTDD